MAQATRKIIYQKYTRPQMADRLKKITLDILRYHLITLLLILLLANGARADDAIENARIALKEKKYLLSFRLLHPLAQQNNAEAQLLLAKYYTLAKNNADNTAKAIFWYKRAASNGNPFAHLQLALLYLDAPAQTNIKKNTAKAADHFEIAAKAGIAKAQYNMALLHSKGAVRRQDWRLVAYWTRLASEQGHAESLYNYGFLHLEGKGVAKDEKAGVHYIGQAALKGLADACFEYAVKVLNGTGVRKNEKIAAKWFKLAALKGHVLAQIKIAQIYLKGTGVEKNYTEAAIWYYIAKKHPQYQNIIAAQDEEKRQILNQIKDIIENMNVNQRNIIKKIAQQFQIEKK